MQYCPGGDILQLIKKKGPLKEETVRKYAAETVLAIEELHKAEIIYRDLKAGNIVLD
jgi:serine/threonine protein kinase